MYNILLTSGGFNSVNNYVSDENRELFKKIAYKKKIVIIANAAPEGTGNFIARENVKQNFLSVGAKSVNILDINSVNIKELLEYDIIYGLGGNITYLIELVQKTDLRNILIEFLKKGIYIGESAGSMILCDDLKWAYDIKKGTKKKYDVILDTYKGLKLTQYKIFPHFNKASEEMNEKIEIYEKEKDIKITRLKDGEIIKVMYKEEY